MWLCSLSTRHLPELIPFLLGQQLLLTARASVLTQQLLVAELEEVPPAGAYIQMFALVCSH